MGPGPGGPPGGGVGNQPPVIDPQAFSVEENSAVGTAVGTVVASDPDGDALTYAITAGNTDGAFAIAATTGALTVANTVPLDFETTPSFSLTVQVTDTGGLSASNLVTVNLIDVAEGTVVSTLLPPPEGDPNFLSTHFSGSGNCATCHNGLTDGAGADISIETDWSTTMMGNSSRDPLWRAKVASELKRNPHLSDKINDKCSRCHAPMANSEAKAAGAPLEILGNGFLNPVNAYHSEAMDGVSCTLCHQIADDGQLGTLAGSSGGYSIESIDGTGQKVAYGQYGDPRINPMQINSGYTPMLGNHTTSSELCATCHDLKTPFVDADGNVVSTTPETEFPEQMVFSEWEASSFGSGAGKTRCQTCHMQPVQEAVKIANRPVRLANRTGFSRHVMTGANTTMLTILADNAAELGVKATGFDATIARTQDFLGTAARLEVLSAGVVEGQLEDQLEVVLKVINESGHKLPTSYPSRRVYIHFQVEDQNGGLVFESGRTNADGSIIGVDSDADPYTIEPHYELVTSQDQVQVYEPIMGTVEGGVTYTLLNAGQYLKDNRLTPAGFDKGAVHSDIGVFGAALEDPDFNLGSDTITYRVGVPKGSGSLSVTVDLRYQALALGYLQDLFQDRDEAEVARFERLYQNAIQNGTPLSELIATITTVVP